METQYHYFPQKSPDAERAQIGDSKYVDKSMQRGALARIIGAQDQAIETMEAELQEVQIDMKKGRLTLRAYQSTNKEMCKQRSEEATIRRAMEIKAEIDRKNRKYQARRSYMKCTSTQDEAAILTAARRILERGAEQSEMQFWIPVTMRTPTLSTEPVPPAHYASVGQEDSQGSSPGDEA